MTDGLDVSEFLAGYLAEDEEHLSASTRNLLAVEEALRAARVRPNHVEGYDRGDWVLMDFFTFIVHVFTPQTREFYSLERLWGDAERIEVSDEPPKSS